MPTKVEGEMKLKPKIPTKQITKAKTTKRQPNNKQMNIQWKSKRARERKTETDRVSEKGRFE